MNKKIGHKGFASLLFFLSQEIFLGVGLTRILSISEQNSWISILIAFVIGFIFLNMIMYVMNYKKDLNVFEKIDILFGKFSKIINFILFSLVTLYFMFSLWNLSIYIQNKFLDQTPKFLIMFLFLIPVIYIVNKDIKTISKVSLICFILSIVEFLASVFGLVNYIDFNNFKPLFTNSFNEIISSSFIIIAYFITPFSLILIVPKNTIDEPKKLNKSFIYFYIIGFLEFLLITSFIISIFGIDYAKLFYYPEFSLLKKISYFDFIEHVENLLSSQWLFSLYIGSVINLYFIKNYLKYLNIKKLKTKKIIYYIIIFVSLFISPRLFMNTTIEYHVVKEYFIYLYSIPIFVLLIIAIILIKKREKSKLKLFISFVMKHILNNKS